MALLLRTKIFILEGPPHQAKALAAMLTDTGYEVQIYGADQPLPDLIDHLPSLIIVQVAGVDSDGYGRCRQLKANPNTAAIPVVLAGIFPDISSRSEVFAAGGADYIELLPRATDGVVTDRVMTDRVVTDRAATDLLARVRRQLEVASHPTVGEAAALRPPLLQASLQRLHNSLDLDTILGTVVRDVRQQTQADRVVIYQFQDNRRGTITHEAVVDQSLSILHSQVEDRCFDQEHAVKYWSGRAGQINDVAALGNLSQCYRDLLLGFNIKANLVVPIIHNLMGQSRYLWGLIILHQCHQPRQWLASDIDLLQELSAHLAIAIQQSRLFEQVRRQARQEMLLKLMLDDIHDSLEVPHILTCTVERLRSALGLHQCGVTLLRHNLAHLPVPFMAIAQQPAQTSPPLPMTERLIRQLRLDHAGSATACQPTPAPSTLYQAQLIIQDQVPYLASAIRADGHIQGVLWAGLEPLYRDSADITSINLERSDLRLLGEVAMQVSQALKQAALYQQLQTVNDELQRLAHLDGLTQIANRREFDRYLAQEWQRLEREQGSLALVLADVDYFKGYNDTYGHLAGDDCLRSMGHLLTQVTNRPADLAARYGGEEFALILPNTNSTGAMALAAEVKTQLARLMIPNQASALYGHVTLSFGIATVIPAPSLSPETLIRRADQALYAAKENGRNRYCLWSETIESTAGVVGR